MFLTIEICSTDPASNLALEEFLLVRREENFVWFWQNEPTVVLGRNQCAESEINRESLERHAIRLVRRISGGGAVYHDSGNLNFSFLTGDTSVGFDFARFTRPLVRTLRRLGLPAEDNGRNDVLVAGKKISGNAQYKQRGRVLHHGTILFESELGRLAEVLRVSPQKYALKKSVPSVRSRVGNIADFLSEKMTIEEFQEELWKDIRSEYPVALKTLSEDEIREIETLRDEKYRSRRWNEGDFSLGETIGGGPRRFDWGTLEVRLQVSGGIIRDCGFYGDFFSPESPELLRERLLGIPFEHNVLEERLDEATIRRVFPELSKQRFLEILLDED